MIMSPSFQDLSTRFRVEDADSNTKWYPHNPIFEHFILIGPKDFDSRGKIDVLYEYPEKKDGQCQFALPEFLFGEDSQKSFIKINKQDDLLSHYLNSNEITDKILLIHSSAGVQYYLYCMKFLATPITLPAFLSPNLTNVILKNRDKKALPISTYAYCIATSHPFPDLYFSLLQQIMQYETVIRNSPKDVSLLNPSTELRGDADPMDYWPLTAFFSRKKFLEALYDLPLPNFCGVFKISSHSTRLQPIKWEMPMAGDVRRSVILFSSSSVLDWISVNQFIDLFSALLLENSIVVVGDSIGQITEAVTFLTQIITPFVWACPLSTIVPPCLLGFLNSPMPTIAGILSIYAKSIPEEKVVVNLGKQTIHIPYKLPIIPGHNILKDLVTNYVKSRNNKHDDENTNAFVRQISLFLEMTLIAPLSRSIVSFIQNGQVVGSMMAEQKFRSQFSPDELQFIKDITDTQLFSTKKEQLCFFKSQGAKRKFLDIEKHQSYVLHSSNDDSLILLSDPDEDIAYVRESSHFPYA